MVAIIGGAIAAAGAVGGSLISSSAAKSAAKTQAAAAGEGQQLQADEFNAIREDLAPFLKAGGSASDAITKLLGLDEGGNPLTSPLLPQAYKPFAPTDLTNTPGYKFTLDQGLKAVNNSFAAKGLGSSGAALKGAAGFATGLADSTYLDQLKAYEGQFTTGNDARAKALSALLGVSQLGETAGAQQGALGTSLAGNQANLGVGAANANAAGEVGSANALAGGIGSVGSSINSALLMQKLFGGSGSSGTLNTVNQLPVASI